MEIQDVIELFRKQVADEEAPYLWDDVEVLQYVIDTQDELITAIGGISVMTVAEADDPDNEELHDLEVTEDEPYSDFSPYILRIRSAKLLTVKRNIRIIDEAGFNQVQTYDYGIQSPAFLDDTDTGPVTHGIIGLVDGKLRWYKVPDGDDTCRLHCYRMAYPRIETQEDALECDERHHIHLITGIKARAFSKNDSEVYDAELAETNKKQFETYCERAKLERDRIRFTPRTVMYGGL